MRQLLILILTTFMFDCSFGQTNFKLKEYMVSYDSEGICDGQSTILLIDYPKDKLFEEKINTIIVKVFNDMMGNNEDYFIFIGDFKNNREFRGNEATAYGLDIITTLLFNKNDLLCLKFEMMSNCGTSVSDHPKYGYVTIDLANSYLINFDLFVDTLQTKKLQSVVKQFAKKTKVDNVPYTLSCDTCPHDQTKIAYLDGLKREFFISDTTIGLFTLILDNNEIDWQRRGSQEGIVGEEFMRVDIPKSIVSEFISEKYKRRIQ